MKIVKDLQKLVETFGVLASLADGGLIAGLALILPQITSSPTVQAWIRWCALLGAMLGVYFTFTGWAGSGRDQCISRRNKYGWLSVSAYLVMVAMVSLTDLHLVQYFGFLQPLRDFLLDVALVGNVSVGLPALAGTYLLLGAVVLSFPNVWDVRLL